VTEPRRWIEPDSDAAEHERDALRSGLNVTVPAAAPDLIWQRVLLTVAPAAASNVDGAETGSPGSPAAGGSLGSGGGLALGAAKAMLLGASAGFLAVGATLVVSPHTEQKRVSSSAQARVSATEVTRARLPGAPPELAPVPEDKSVTPLPASRGEREKQAVAIQSAPRSAEHASEPSLSGDVAPVPGTSTASSVRSELKAEADLIREARARLRQGELERAEALLESAERRFRAPALVQEREALTIELFRRSGRTQLARARAREFLRRFPGSAHGAELAEWLGKQ
jgi:hypothetical protein